MVDLLKFVCQMAVGDFARLTLFMVIWFLFTAATVSAVGTTIEKTWTRVLLMRNQFPGKLPSAD